MKSSGLCRRMSPRGVVNGWGELRRRARTRPTATSPSTRGGGTLRSRCGRRSSYTPHRPWSSIVLQFSTTACGGDDRRVKLLSGEMAADPSIHPVLHPAAARQSVRRGTTFRGGARRVPPWTFFRFEELCRGSFAGAPRPGPGATCGGSPSYPAGTTVQDFRSKASRIVSARTRTVAARHDFIDRAKCSEYRVTGSWTR